MSRAFIALALGLALSGNPFQWASSLVKALYHDGTQSNADGGGTFDPNGAQANSDWGSSFDPNG